MQRIEDILNSALAQIKNGEDVSSVLSAYPENVRAELKELINTSLFLSGLETKKVPVATRRRTYAQYDPAPTFAQKFLALFKAGKVILPIGTMLVLLAATGTTYAAMSSLPGSHLFTIRKAVENAQVKLATNPQAKAKLELEFANARIDDVQKVLSTNQSEQVHQVALNELRNQTETAVNNLKQASDVVKDPEVLKNVEKLSQAQTKLTANSNSSDTTKDQKVASDLKKIIATAKEESKTDIQTADVVETNGQITFISLKNSNIKVDNNTFEITTDTTLKDKNDTVLTIEDLGINDKVKIQAQLKDSKNIANSITLMNRVKPLPEKAAEKITEKKPVTEEKPKAATPVINAEPQPDPIPEKPQDTFGNVIIEPPLSSF